MKSDLANYYEQLSDREFFLAGRVIAFIWLFKVLMFSPELASGYPFELIIPTGILTLVSEGTLKVVFSFPVITTLKAVLIVLLIIFQIRIQKIWTACFLFFLLLIYSNLNHSFGAFLNHSEIAVFVSFLIFIIALCIRKVESDMDSQAHILFFFSLTTVVIVVCYSMIGVFRVLHGGFELFTGDYMLITVMERSIQRIDTVFTFGLLFAKYAWFQAMLNAFFLFTTILEILSPLIFFSKVFRYVWLSVMIPFHVSTLLLMNIFFWENILLILILTTPVLKYINANMELSSVKPMISSL